MSQIDPQRQGLLAAAFQGLQASGPSRMPTSLGQIMGQAGQAGMQAQREGQNDQLRQQQFGMQQQMQQMQYAQHMEALKKQQQMQALIPMFANNPAASLLAQSGDYKGAVERMFPKAEYDLKEMMGPDGKPTYGYFPKNPGAGAITSSGVSPVPKLHFGDTGAGILPMDSATGAAVGPMIPKTATPGEILTDNRTRSEGAANRGNAAAISGKPVWDSSRGVFVTQPGIGGGYSSPAPQPSAPAAMDASSPQPTAPRPMTPAAGPRAITPAGLPEQPNNYGTPQEVTVGGKPRLVVQRKSDGAMVDAETKAPITSLGPKLGEAAQKQIAGVVNTKNALAEYRDALKNWSMLDAANPSARARMGTVYNNALLQAKEAFNLGVLNGPDYSILQSVLTDPASLKGGITSKKALDDQAAKLEELMSRIGTSVAEVQSGNAPNTSRKVVRTGTYQGKRVVEYSDGTREFQ
jgi:hypothetical protein